MMSAKTILKAGVVMFGGILLLSASGALLFAAEEATFGIKRLAVCENVENREPVGVSDRFSANTQKVYAFLEAVNISADTEIDFVWFHGGNEMLRVPVSLGQGARWRTYANKNLYGLAGTWRVEIQNKAGEALGAVQFQVE